MYQHQRFQLLYFDEVVQPFSKETQFVSNGRNLCFLIDFISIGTDRRTWTVDITKDGQSGLNKEDVGGTLYFLKGRAVSASDVKDCLVETYATDEFYRSFLFKFPADIEFDKVLLNLRLGSDTRNGKGKSCGAGCGDAVGKVDPKKE
jgi:hypothetical protein